MAYDYDLFVIGAGSGGVRASRFAAKDGAKVAVCEDSDLGGTCVNVGCVPKKLFVYGSHYAEDFKYASGYGWTVGPTSFDWKTLLANKNKEIDRLNRIYGRLLHEAGVDLIQGRGKVTGPNEVTVGDKSYSARYILVCTGGWPTIPDIPGAEHGITSNEFFHFEELPERILVVGGGYIGVELTCILHGLGAKVRQIYRGSLFLRGFDADVRSFLAEEMRKAGIDLHFETDLHSIEKLPSGELLAFMEDGDEHTVDAVLFATGRHPRTEGLGLDQVGVKLDERGAVVVDDHFKTTVDSIYAVGDVTGLPALTPVALTQGMAVVRTLFGDEPTPVDYDHLPTAIFSQPPVGTVGLSEHEAREQYAHVDVYRSTFTPMKHTMTESQEKTLMKLVVDRDTGKVLGCHMVGPDAGEIIQGFAVALKCGATKAEFDATIGIHPTAAEEFVTMREPQPEPEPPAPH